MRRCIRPPPTAWQGWHGRAELDNTRLEVMRDTAQDTHFGDQRAWDHSTLTIPPSQRVIGWCSGRCQLGRFLQDSQLWALQRSCAGIFVAGPWNGGPAACGDSHPGAFEKDRNAHYALKLAQLLEAGSCNDDRRAGPRHDRIHVNCADLRTTGHWHRAPIRQR
jgi:hypothetical protein